LITCEVPLRSIQSQRECLAILQLEVSPETAAFIEGAIAVLDWMEHGGDTPLEMAGSRACERG